MDDPTESLDTGEIGKRRIAPLDTWPDLRLVLRPLPWGWRLRPRFYADGLYPSAHFTVSWLFLTVEWWAEDKPRWWFVETPEGAAHNARKMGHSGRSVTDG